METSREPGERSGALRALWRARIWWLPPILIAVAFLVALAIFRGEGPIAAFVYSLR